MENPSVSLLLHWLVQVVEDCLPRIDSAVENLQRHADRVRIDALQSRPRFEIPKSPQTCAAAVTADSRPS